jgi:hypothetical protein
VKPARLSLLLLGCALLASAPASSAALDLTGNWKCDDGGIYEMRMIVRGNLWELFWYGKGDGWQNVFHGINKSPSSSNDFVGRWASLSPAGPQNFGIIAVHVEADNKLTLTGDPRNFAGRVWTRSADPQGR